ncbi:MAG TPA: DNRLRE domain-containing protein [Gammaproteobacteria bacterium]
MRTQWFAYALCLCAVSSPAQDVALPLTGDAYVNALQPSRNYGADTRIVVHNYGPKEGLVQFDAATIAGADVSQATLRLFLADALARGTVLVHAVNSSWSESSVSFSTTPPVESTAVGSVTFALEDVGSTVSIDVTETVQKWADGALPAAGFLLTTSEPIRAVFDTKESSGGAHPTLDVTVADSGPRPPRNRVTHVLDLSAIPAVIDEPGIYVLDRDWSFGMEVPIGSTLIEIVADGVLLDLRGFRVSQGFEGFGIRIEGNAVTVRNGSLSAVSEGIIIAGGGRATTIEDLHVAGGGRGGIELGGPNATVARITTSASQLLVAGPGSVVKQNTLDCLSDCVELGESVRMMGNFMTSDSGGIISIQGNGNLLTSNTVITSGFSALLIHGDANIVADNVLVPMAGVQAGNAITVQGTRNILRGNLAAPDGEGASWTAGIEFQQDGNFFGDNQVAATVPFDLGGTVQTDWGDNIGF